MPLTWPVSLPTTFKQGSLQASTNERVIRTQMDQGPMKVRLRDSVSFKIYSGEISIKNNTLRDAFWNFYNSDALQGAEPFQWTDPYSGATKNFRFVSAPSETHVGGDVSTVSFTVEEVPS